MRFQANCQCGFEGPITTDRKASEVIADQHETQMIRRQYLHDTRVETVFAR